MTRPTAFATPLVSFTLFTLVSIGSLAPALATTVTDTFPLKLTGKEWCRNDPKFFDTKKVTFTDGVTLTLTLDVLNTGDLTDVQATINTHGLNATIDAIILNGRALKSNKPGSLAQLALSGHDPANPDHILTIRGQATFDKTGKLTKVTGTYVYQILSESGGVQDVDCFGSGTFGAQKLPSSGGGGGGTLTVAHAPASVGGKFVANAKFTFTNVSGTEATVVWNEHGTTHAEGVTLIFDTITGELSWGFSFAGVGGAGGTWGCFALQAPACPPGASVNRTAGTFTLVDTVMEDVQGLLPPITLNGTLRFTPF